MGWHIGMSEEEMRIFFCPTTTKSSQSTGRKCDGESSDDVTKSYSDGRSGTVPVCIDEIPSQAKQQQEPAPSGAKQQMILGTSACPLAPCSLPPPPPPDVLFIYHLCQESNWVEAVDQKLPYFPPTYMKDRKFTRASVNKSDIVDVANIYYKETPGKWIVLELNCQLLYSLGIPILAQESPESVLLKTPVKCLQIFGGISTTVPGLVHQIHPVFRKNATGEFVKLLDPITGSASLPCLLTKLPPKTTVDTSSEVDLLLKRTEVSRPNLVSTEQPRRTKSLFSKLRWAKR